MHIFNWNIDRSESNWVRYVVDKQDLAQVYDIDNSILDELTFIQKVVELQCSINN